jgi:hypothetical protein
MKRVNFIIISSKAAVIHIIRSMGIDNTHVPMKTAVTCTIWSREETTPSPNENCSDTHHLKYGNRQHPGPNEDCSDTHHLKYGNRQHPGFNENCSDAHHLKYGNANCSDAHHLMYGNFSDTHH